MSKGTVKNFQQSKGFGFISGNDGKDIFFHQSAVQGGAESVREGMLVEFDVSEGPKGKRAENVRIV